VSRGEPQSVVPDQIKKVAEASRIAIVDSFSRKFLRGLRQRTVSSEGSDDVVRFVRTR
jgi:hypothetical protein